MRDLEENIVSVYLSEVSSRSSFFISIDEVGRGSAFGPVTVTGVLANLEFLKFINRQPIESQIKDSKQLSQKQREQIFSILDSYFLYYTYHVPAYWIDKYNINLAIQYGVYRIIYFFIDNYISLRDCLFVLVDGNYRFAFPNLKMPCPVPPIETRVKGDSRYITLSCASIIGKVIRDRMIEKVDKKFSKYDLKNNKGYLTVRHIEAIEKYGLTKYHRKSFLKKLYGLN